MLLQMALFYSFLWLTNISSEKDHCVENSHLHYQESEKTTHSVRESISK